MSWNNDDEVKIWSFDGQAVYLDKNTILYEVGNFLGGGAAGTVYECEHVKTREHFALKILNPIGYKLLSPALLRRCNIVVKGTIVTEEAERTNNLAMDNIWWLLNGATKHYLASFHSEQHNCLKELSLIQCIKMWGSNPTGVGEDDSGHNDSSVEVQREAGGARLYVPSVPPKYCDFVRRRNRIFREIRNMRKISMHQNVIKLKGVLELTQESKCTIFLVMELANGGELFDRIKIDCGTREDTAKFFFQQLLEGVNHCHGQGVCHRDLKPENLLLQDTPEKATVLKIADFGFSARFLQAQDQHEASPSNASSSSTSQNPNQVLYSALTPPVQINHFPEETTPIRALKSVVGSPFYVAPEVLQASIHGYDGPKADIWSIGVILYAMLAGNLPFEQELSTCKRFRLFCKWIREQGNRGVDFWDDPTIDYPPWLFPSKFSFRAKGLIVAMLHPDPEKRITVSEAMRHPLVIEDQDAVSIDQVPLPSPAATQPATTVTVSVVIDRTDDEMQQGRSCEKIADDGVIMDVDAEVEMNDDTRRDSLASDDGDLFQMEEDEVSSAHGAEASKSYRAATPDTDAVESPKRPASFVASEPMAIQSSTRFAAASPHDLPYMLGSSPMAKLPPLAPPIQNNTFLSDLLSPGDEDTGDLRGSARSSEPGPTSPTSAAHPPSFSDLVKRSTRFITAVPAAEVLEKVEHIVEQHRLQKTLTPIGLIGKVQVNWESFRLEVWGPDVNGPHLCELQLYVLPASISHSPGQIHNLAASPSDQYGSFGAGPAPLYLVEFIRGQLEIFAFKRFYQWIRQRVSELVKRDYTIKIFDQAASPLVSDSFMRRQYEHN